MNDNYTGVGAIYAGMVAPAQYPVWRQGLALYETVVIPHVGNLASINPENNPAINPNYPAAAPWRGSTGFPALMSAYCGAAYDDSTGEYWLPLSGGHQDYAGNEQYKATVIADQLQWSMIRNPSGAIGNVITLNDGLESSGVYSDGRLRAVHSYSYSCAANGKIYAAALIGQYHSGQTGKRWVVEIDKITGEYTLICDYSDTPNIGSGYGGAAIDPTRSKMFISGQETTRFVVVDLTSGTYVNIGALDNIFGAYSTAVYAPEPDRVIFVARQRVETEYKAHRGIAVINPATNTVVYPACGDFPAFIGGAVGAAWVGNALWVWDNATSTNTFAVLTPSNLADLAQPWTVSTITTTGATITAAQGAGTYNRLQYSERLGGVLLINAVNQPMFFTRTN